MSQPLEFDRTDSRALKGIAISAIVLHNYFHLIPPIKENEFDFDPQRFFIFLTGVQEPQQALQSLMSYLGHFGVQVFIFLSAYGLAKTYWDTPQSWPAFLWGRVTKIYPAFLFAIALWILFAVVYSGPSVISAILGAHAPALLLTAGGIINLIPGYGLPPVGPWWFLPFIMQVYCIWPMLRAFARRFRAAGLLILAVAGLILTGYADHLHSPWEINLLESPLGHMPELCLGIAAARYGFRPGLLIVGATATVFVLGNLSVHLWLLTFVSILILSLWMYSAARHWLRDSAVLNHLGARAMPLFFVNGFVRFPFVEIARDQPWAVGLALGIVSFGLSLGIAELIWRLQNRRLASEAAGPRAARDAFQDNPG